MKKNILLLFTMISLILSSCRKLYDQYISNPKVVRNLCRITKVTFYLKDQVAAYNISYDDKGNITSMLTDKFGEASRENYYFRYDKKNVLTDRLVVYVGGTGTAEWDSYIYYRDKIMDTSYFYKGLITDTHPPYDAPSKHWVELTSDPHGRIIREVYPYNDTLYYKYDKNGNLVIDPPLYDNKINPYLTNPMWQLIYRDYSVNNAINNVLISYNAYGLPAKYKAQYPHSAILFGHSCDSLEISYDCDVPKTNY